MNTPIRPSDPRTVVVVLGPTGVGKSALSLDLAEAIGGEIVNADSMQLYRGMDIGTAKLAVAERRGIPHHVLDVWDLDRLATVADYQQLAREAIVEIQTRDRVPILVGGSGLYINAAVDAMEFPGVDPVIRAKWEAELERIGPEDLHAVLARRDPTAAALMEPKNGRRTVRALEVIEITGKPYNAGLGVPAPFLPTIRLGLRRPREQLDAIVAERVQHMWRSGWVDEVRRLLAQGLAQAPTASRALGYSQITAMLAGDITQAQAIESTTNATRRFVRRQHSWFDRDERITWLEASAPAERTNQVLAEALSAIR
ncbi:MAG: tRNA (adenosine(37)-N6)-dimethylallyltransferase MiaA [Candidatus Nanopelagicales bacterium]